MKLRPTLLAAVLLGGVVLAAAAMRYSVGSWRVDAETPCQVLLGDPPDCETPNPRGRIPTEPLEWGRAARAELWQGRLHCATGALPRAQRFSMSVKGVKGSTTPPKLPLAPPAEDPDEPSTVDDAEMIDSWVVACPGETERRWYTSTYRCGDPCLPEGFRVAPLAVLADLEGAIEAGDAQAAEQAIQGSEDLELPVRLLLKAAITASDPKLVLKAVGHLEALNLPTTMDRVRKAAALLATGAAAPGRQLLKTLADEASSGEIPPRDLLCLLAEIAETGDLRSDAASYREAACGTEKECCAAP